MIGQTLLICLSFLGCARKPRVLMTNDGTMVLFTYFENGRVESSSEVIINGTDTIKQGVGYSYYDSGIIRARKSYLKDSLFGPQWSYDENGKLEFYICYGVEDESLYFRSYNSEGKTLLVKGHPLYHIETDPGPHQLGTLISIKFLVAETAELKSFVNISLTHFENELSNSIEYEEMQVKNGVCEYSFMPDKTGRYLVEWTVNSIDSFLNDTLLAQETFYYDVIEQK